MVRNFVKNGRHLSKNPSQDWPRSSWQGQRWDPLLPHWPKSSESGFRYFGRQAAHDCLEGKRILVAGDSTTRDTSLIFEEIMYGLDKLVVRDEPFLMTPREIGFLNVKQTREGLDSRANYIPVEDTEDRHIILLKCLQLGNSANFHERNATSFVSDCGKMGGMVYVFFVIIWMIYLFFG